jgi:hypothetical protein
MSFSEQLEMFASHVDRRNADLFHAVVFAAHESITLGSLITGAPGQPVQAGALRNSYQMSWDSQWTARVASALRYAWNIENAIRGSTTLTRRSKVGGFHSIALTVDGFTSLVEHVNRQLEGGA